MWKFKILVLYSNRWSIPLIIQLVGERLEENKFKILELNLYIKIKNK
jgi:hypothetical protein